MEDLVEKSDATAWDRPCPHCGAAVQQAARRCPFCGGDISPEDLQQPDLRPMNVDPEGVRDVSVVIIVILIFLVPIALALWVFGAVFW